MKFTSKFSRVCRWLHLKLITLLIATAVVSGISCSIVLIEIIWQPDLRDTDGRKQSEIILKKGRAEKEIVNMEFHADVSINSVMHRGIDKAVQDLSRVSCGLAKAKIIWDYHKPEDFPMAALTGKSIIYGMSVADVEKSLGRKDADELLGMTKSTKNPNWNPAWIFLVVDKLEKDEELTEWTVLHEICHALGMNHIKKGLMQPNAPFYFEDEFPIWSQQDKEEFCRLYDCDTDALNKCSK
jgi:hypothetical protein